MQVCWLTGYTSAGPLGRQILCIVADYRSKLWIFPYVPFGQGGEGHVEAIVSSRSSFQARTTGQIKQKFNGEWATPALPVSTEPVPADYLPGSLISSVELS